MFRELRETMGWSSWAKTSGYGEGAAHSVRSNIRLQKQEQRCGIFIKIAAASPTAAMMLMINLAFA